MSTNVFLRDLDLVSALRINELKSSPKVSQFSTGLLAIDTTLVSPIRAGGEPHQRCAEVDGAAMEVARQRKEKTYPELTSGAKLVVLAGEIGGRSSVETQTFIPLLARAKTRAVPQPGADGEVPPNGRSRERFLQDARCAGVGCS